MPLLVTSGHAAIGAPETEMPIRES